MSPFPERLTPYLRDLIAAEGPDGPIARQYLPDPREAETRPEERADPIGDAAHSPVKGVVHRYGDRALLTPVMACPVHCRFCFRREAVGGPHARLNDDELAAALAYLRAHAEVWEVILSGGDPLTLPPERLGRIVAELDGIPHVRVIRIHTRLPVADPPRMRFPAAAARACRAPIYAVIHCNHASELTPAARDAFDALRAAGVHLLAQTVLLRGVNDSVEALEALMRDLVALGVMPYHLHHPDLARGTGHFRLGLEEGRDLVRRLSARVSGLCRPTYVLDIPGGHGKVPVAASHVGDDGWVEDWQGGRHPYPRLP